MAHPKEKIAEANGKCRVLYMALAAIETGGWGNGVDEFELGGLQELTADIFQTLQSTLHDLGKDGSWLVAHRGDVKTASAS